MTGLLLSCASDISLDRSDVVRCRGQEHQRGGGAENCTGSRGAVRLSLFLGTVGGQELQSDERILARRGTLVGGKARMESWLQGARAGVTRASDGESAPASENDGE